jgi:NAD-dependent dihydropyrimidine dehydrogenase PreA subunit
MIEFLLEDQCIGCDICTEVCPQDVFDTQPGAPPIIARQEDCHSCRQCNLHCPVAAIHVSLLREPTPNIDQDAIVASGRITAYADWLGWTKGRAPSGDKGHYLLLKERRGEQEPDPGDRVRRQLFEVSNRTYL